MYAAEYLDHLRVRDSPEQLRVGVLAGVGAVDSILVRRLYDQIGKPRLPDESSNSVGRDARPEPSHHGNPVLSYVRDGSPWTCRDGIYPQRHPNEPGVQSRGLYRDRVLLLVWETDSTRRIDVLPGNASPADDNHRFVAPPRDSRYDVGVSLHYPSVRRRAQDGPSETQDYLQVVQSSEPTTVQSNDSSYKALTALMFIP